MLFFENFKLSRKLWRLCLVFQLLWCHHQKNGLIADVFELLNAQSDLANCNYRWYKPLSSLPIQSHISNWLTQMNCHPSIPLLLLLLQKVCTMYYFFPPPTKVFTPYPLREHKGSLLPQLHYQVKDKSKHASPIACSFRQPMHWLPIPKCRPSAYNIY